MHPILCNPARHTAPPQRHAPGHTASPGRQAPGHTAPPGRHAPGDTAPPGRNAPGHTAPQGRNAPGRHTPGHHQGELPQDLHTQPRPPSPDMNTLTQAIPHSQASRTSLDIFHQTSTQPDQDQHCPPALQRWPSRDFSQGPSYAQVISGSAGPATHQLRDIQQMLSVICSQLMVQRQW